MISTSAFSLLAVAFLTVVTAHRVAKIVGGDKIHIEQVPYQVSLQQQNDNGVGTRHICGGSIINQKFILTAGK